MPAMGGRGGERKWIVLCPMYLFKFGHFVIQTYIVTRSYVPTLKFKESSLAGICGILPTLGFCIQGDVAATEVS